MLTFEEAVERVREYTPKLETGDVALENSLGAVLAADVCSDIDMPPFDKSFRDGYAVRSSDIASIPAILDVIGESKAGKPYDASLGKGQAVATMTGAPVPLGADAIVMIEDTERLFDGGVRVHSNSGVTQYMCRRGDDVAKGSIVLAKGTVVREAEVGVLATVGRARVHVFRCPTVAIIVTGDELVSCDQVPGEWGIRDCNGPLLTSLLKKDGYSVTNLGIVADDRESLKQAIEEGLESDVVLLSGGVSAGKYDFVPEMLESLGVEKIFHKARMKPGKPLYFGRKGDRLCFGMPGNPVSTFFCYNAFVRRALAQMKGLDFPELDIRDAVTQVALRRGRRKTFLPVCVNESNGSCEMNTVDWHGSADIFALSRSNALAVIDIGEGEISAGTSVPFFYW